MDSIKQNQKEENFRNLIGQEALEKITDLAKKAGSCFFCTKLQQGQPFSTRPMSGENIDDEGNSGF